MAERRFTWRPAAYDAVNNWRLGVTADLVDMPKVMFLINSLTERQEKGDCVFNALVTHLESIGVNSGTVPPVDLSRMFAYYQYRKRFGEVSEDNGASIFYALKVLSGTGICAEELWPYVEGNYAREPSPEAYRDALARPIGSYCQLVNLGDMLSCIASGFGFVGGISVYDSFESDVTERTGVVSMPGKGDKFLGGHAIYFCGYDLHKNAMQFQNSWGLEWASESNYPGHGWIPFEYLANPFLAGEFFTLRPK